MLQALGSKPWQGSHSERLRSPTANADKDAQSQAQKLFLIHCALDTWCTLAWQLMSGSWCMLMLAYWPERPEEIFIEVGLLFWGKAASGGSESKGWQQKSCNSASGNLQCMSCRSFHIVSQNPLFHRKSQKGDWWWKAMRDITNVTDCFIPFWCLQVLQLDNFEEFLPLDPPVRLDYKAGDCQLVLAWWKAVLVAIAGAKSWR